MSDYTDWIVDEIERPWIVKDADGEHTREDAPTTPPEFVAPVSISELEDFALDSNTDPLAIFDHRTNSELQLWVWDATPGVALEYYSEPGNSLAYWTSRENLRDVLEYAFNRREWNLEDMRPPARMAAIDALVECAEGSE